MTTDTRPLAEQIAALCTNKATDVALQNHLTEAVKLSSLVAAVLRLFADRPRGQQAGGHRCRCSHEARALADEIEPEISGPAPLIRNGKLVKP